MSLDVVECSDNSSDRLMASITKDAHQPPRSPFWIACYNGVGSDGRLRRLKRSTKTTDRKLAQKLGDKWERSEAVCYAKQTERGVTIEPQFPQSASLVQQRDGKTSVFHRNSGRN